MLVTVQRETECPYARLPVHRLLPEIAVPPAGNRRLTRIAPAGGGSGNCSYIDVDNVTFLGRPNAVTTPESAEPPQTPKRRHGLYDFDLPTPSSTSGKKGKKKAAESQSVAFKPTLSQSTASTSTLSQSMASTSTLSQSSASTPTYGTRSSTAKSVGSNVSAPAQVEGEGGSH
ncbi:hypothetical protein EI94DRAFT_1704495 [Lactarius quietus]|nr:hypothetical protein EI94DRAFT_1704495 [Lactarius quietus]